MNVKVVSKNVISNKIPVTIGVSEKIIKLAEITPVFKMGEMSGYLSDQFGQAELDQLELGHCAIISTDVGTGKTTAILKIAAVSHNTYIYIITNRKYCLIQQKRDCLKLMGISVSDWSDEAIIGYNTGKVKFLTYQKLAKKGGFYKFPKESIVVLDEIHYLLNDSVFSSDPMIVKCILHQNKEHTKRVYISATIDEVIDEIIMLESKYIEPTPIEQIFRNDEMYQINSTCIDQVYIMASNWEHISLKFYNYSNTDELAEHLNEITTNGKKSIVFIRSKSRGEKLKEKLADSAMVFSTDDEMPILTEISNNAQYSCGSLISTKILENGVSIIDPRVDTIVIDEPDPIAFKQFLGRVRNRRISPRKITVIIPDYSISELIQLRRYYYEQIKIIQQVIDNPEYCMANSQIFSPYVYYDLTRQSPAPNYLALKKFENLYNFMNNLIDEEKERPHAYISSVQRLLCLPEVTEDKQFLNYNDISAFKESVAAAYKRFISSPMLKSNRDELAKELIKAVTNTNIYTKKITGSQLQMDKINDILACAGINTKIESLGESFGLVN